MRIKHFQILCTSPTFKKRAIFELFVKLMHILEKVFIVSGVIPLMPLDTIVMVNARSDFLIRPNQVFLRRIFIIIGLEPGPKHKSVATQTYQKLCSMCANVRFPKIYS